MAGLIATPATAQIYRCSEGETTVFSDTPCSESAETYQVGANISVIGTVDNLDEITASNQAFLEQRRQQLAERGERAAQRRAENRRMESRRAMAEYAPRRRSVVGHLNGLTYFGANRFRLQDPRTRARRERQAEEHDEQDRRRTLLSRSGGNQRKILR